MRTPVDQDPTRPIVPLRGAVVLAAAGGLLLDGAFPDRDWWPLAFAGIALVLVAAHGRRAWGGFLVGLVFGASFYFLHIVWATTFLGPLPWAALSTVMALWCAGGTMLISMATRVVPRIVRGAAGRLLLVPFAIAGLWTLREAVASVWPYGGFAWGRVALSQSASPISDAFAWLGVSGVGFAMVLVVAVALAAAREVALPRLLRACLATAVAAILVAIPAWPAADEGTLRVAAIQGNGKTGYFDPPERRGDNLLDQVEATEAAIGEDVDVVVWPEGGSDLDPLRVPEAARVFDDVVEATGAPLVAGTVTKRGEEYFNTSLVWKTGEGATGYYDKRHPVPFGEYVPDRAFWRQFAPELIDMIQREYTPGTTPVVMDIGREGEPLLAGIAICFDIVDDAVLRETVTAGGRIVLAQTNNADFGRTDESVQQLAIARIRAIELGRTVVNISTVGTSAIILPDGSIAAQLPTYEAGAMIEDVPLRTTTTPAAVAGAGVEWGVSVAALGILIGAAASGAGRRTSAPARIR